MFKRIFGASGAEVSVIGQGTWKLQRPDNAETALGLGLQLGLTHIDTAELYRGSEEIISRVLKDRRDEVFLVSKVLPTNSSYEGTLAACERSLKRMRTDHVDTYLLHWWSDQHPIEDTMRAMGELVDAGKTRFVGVSNLSVEELESAQQALGRRKIVCNQVYYAPQARNVENEVLPFCKKNNIAIVAYSPFGSGHFPSEKSAGGKAIRDVAQRTGLTPHQVVLNFLARDPSVFVIPKAETSDHVRENAGALTKNLAREDIEQLERAFPLGTSGELQYV